MDYAYSDQLQQALKSDPAMERELSTVHAIASQYAAMQESLPYIREYLAAGTQAEADAVTARYSYLFSSTRPEVDVQLKFSSDGSLQPTTNGHRIPAGANE